MKIGGAIVDFKTLTIKQDGEEEFIEPKIMKVLEALIDNAGEVVTREDLIDQVWGIGYGTDERLTRAIYVLRKALKDTGKPSQYIRTIPKTGYQMVADIAPSAEELTKPKPTAKLDAASSEEQSVEPASYPQPKSPGFFGRIMISTISALLVLGIISFVNYNRSALSTEKVNPSVNAGLDGIYNYTRKGAIAEAQENFELMLAEDPDDAAARSGLSLALIREYTHLERDPALINRAHSAAEAAYRLDPNLALSNISKGWAAEFRSDYEGAHKFLDRAEILDPNNVLTLESRTRVFYKQGKFEDAKIVLNQAIDANPDYPVYYNFLGQFHLRDNDLPLAENAFRKLLALSGDTNSRAYGQLAHTLYHQDKANEAIQTLQDGLEIEKTASLYSNLGTYLFFQGQYDMSAEAFEHSIEFAGDSHFHLHWGNLGDAYRQVPGKQDKANKAYKRAAQLLEAEFSQSAPNITTRSQLALYNAKRGEHDLAREQLSKIDTDLATTSSDLFRLALIYEVLAERSLAISYLGKAMQAGYTMKEIMHEPELDRLRQDKDFHFLLTSLETKNE